MTSVDMQPDSEKINCHLKFLAQNMQSNRQPLKSSVFCRVHWAFNSGSKGLYMFHQNFNFTTIQEFELDKTGQMAGTCEYGNKSPSTMKCKTFLTG